MWGEKGKTTTKLSFGGFAVACVHIALACFHLPSWFNPVAAFDAICQGHRSHVM